MWMRKLDKRNEDYARSCNANCVCLEVKADLKNVVYLDVIAISGSD